MSDERDGLLLPVLGWGLAGGLVGSLSCCCWLGPAAAGWIGARRGASHGHGPIVGVGIGAISALVVGSLGTALFLATTDAELLAEVGAGDLSLGALAASYAVLGAFAALVGGALGGVLGARSTPAEAPPSALRFLDPAPPPIPASGAPPAAPAAVTPPPQSETPAEAGAVEVEGEDLASSDDERDAWDA